MGEKYGSYNISLFNVTKRILNGGGELDRNDYMFLYWLSDILPGIVYQD